jgi:hypothetical protein
MAKQAEDNERDPQSEMSLGHGAQPAALQNLLFHFSTFHFSTLTCVSH